MFFAVSFICAYCEEKSEKANLSFLRGMPDEPWWRNEYENRIPILITETAGLKRYADPICIDLEFPVNTNPNSIRVLTVSGKELPSQINVKKENGVEISFSITLEKHENVPLFIYFSKNTEIKPAVYETDLSIRDKKEYYEISNNFLKVEILKKPGEKHWPRQGPSFIKRIHIMGSAVDNELCPREPDRAWAGHVLKNLTFDTAELIEDGPVKKTILFKSNSVLLSYTLYNQSNRLDYKIKPLAETTQVNTHTGWAPYGDLKNDIVLYEDSKGLKSLPGCTGEVTGSTSSYPEYSNLRPSLTEGWIALSDKRGETVGEFFSLEKCFKCSVWIHHLLGGGNVHLTFKSSSPITGALSAIIGNGEAFRDNYLSWRHPPVISVAAVQKNNGKTFKAPRYDIDNVREILIDTTRRGARENSKTAEAWVDKMQSMGANSIKLGIHEIVWPTSHEAAMKDPGRTDYLVEFTDAAHKRGVAVRLWGNYLKKYKEKGVLESFCDQKIKQRIIEDFIEMAKAGIDMVYLKTGDENHHLMRMQLIKEFREGFKNTYGIEFPEIKSKKQDFEMRTKGAPDCYPFLYMEIQYNQFTKELSEAIRTAVPNVPLGILCSGSGALKRDVDIEEKARYLDTIDTELVLNDEAPDLAHLKYGIRFPLGALGNRGKSVQHHFYFEKPSERMKTVEMELPLIFGIKSFCHETIDYELMDPKFFEGTQAFYKFLNFTGIDKFLQGAAPLKFTAVFRDRNAYLDDIVKGNIEAGMSIHEYRARGLMGIRNIPMDIIVNRFFSPQELKKYKLLIIPNDQCLSEKSAAAVDEYVKEGGILLTEGETINNHVIADIAGVKKTGEVKKKGIIKTSSVLASGITQIEAEKRVSVVPMKPVEILATDQKNNPALLLSKYGKGKVLYSPFILTDGIPSLGNKTKFMEKIIGFLSEPLPMQIADGQEIESSILKNGNEYLLGVYNPSQKETDFVLKLSIPVTDSYKILAFDNGNVIDFTDRLSITLKPMQVKLYLITPEALLKMPQATACPNKTGYSCP